LPPLIVPVFVSVVIVPELDTPAPPEAFPKLPLLAPEPPLIAPLLASFAIVPELDTPALPMAVNSLRLAPPR
jgi:hypothetical protein